MSNPEDYEDNLAEYERTTVVKAGKIESVEPLDEHQNVGFLLTLEDVEDEYELTFDQYVALGCQIGGYLVWGIVGAASDPTFIAAAEFEENYDLVPEGP